MTKMPKWIGPKERAARDKRLIASISGKKTAVIPAVKPTFWKPTTKMMEAPLTNFARLKQYQPVTFKTKPLTTRQDVSKGGFRAIELGVLDSLQHLRQNEDRFSKTFGTIGATYDFSSPRGTQYDVKYVHMTPTKNNIDWNRTEARITEDQHAAWLKDPKGHKFIAAYQGWHQTQNNFTMKLLKEKDIANFHKK